MLVCIVIKCTESDYFAVLNERIYRKSWQQCSKLQLLGNLTIAEFKLLKHEDDDEVILWGVKYEVG